MITRGARFSLALSLGLAMALAGLWIFTARAAPGNPVLDPPANTHHAPVTTTVSITYNEAIDAATVTSRTFAVHGMQGGLVTATYAVSGGMVSVHPVRPFLPGELVQATATTGTLTPGGDGPLAPTVWQFRTAVQSGTGHFSAIPNATFGAGNSRSVTLGDLDGDSDLDAVVVNFNAASTVWRNEGRGTYTTAASLGGSASWDAALGDLDADGDLDLVLANRNNQPQQVWFNDGHGGFPLSTTVGGGYDSRAVALGDLDGDGDLDAVTANDDQPQVAFFNDGHGSFPISTTFGSGDSHDVTLGDLDGDGDLDALVANGSRQAQQVWYNDGRGAFPISGTFGAGRTQAVALGDLDGDGDSDALLAGNNGDPQEVWLNDGDGTFPISTTFGAGTSRDVALGDLNADGNLDAFVTHYNGEAHEVWTNDGRGVFFPSGTFGGGRSWGAALGDVDGDGDLDAVVATDNDQAQEVWLNRDARRVYVDGEAAGAGDGSSWKDAYVHLQDALDEANAQSDVAAYEIWVASGVYYPDEDSDGDHAPGAVTETFRLRHNATRLYGGFAGTETELAARRSVTIPTVLSGDVDGNDGTDSYGVVTHTSAISGSNANHVLWLDGRTDGPITEDTILDGVTITGGWVGDSAPHDRGAGLTCDGSDGGTCSPTLIHVDFISNRADGGGGGMLSNGSNGGVSNPSLRGSVFRDNYAISGGGMFNDGSEGGTSSPRLTYTAFEGNFADVEGGGMLNDGSNGGVSSPLLIDVYFSGNLVNLSGGGMLNRGTGGDSTPLMIFTYFNDNWSLFSSGGAMTNEASDPTLVNAYFRRNEAADGGAVDNVDSTATLINALFDLNEAYSDGGAMRNTRSDPVLINVTLSGNRANRGGGLANLNSRPVLTNVILWGNHAPTGTVMLNDVATPTLATSLIEDGWDGSGVVNLNGGYVIDGGGNLDADPQFVRDPDRRKNGDLRLRTTSPAIDAGDNRALPAEIDLIPWDPPGHFSKLTLTLDLALNPRFTDISGVPDTGLGTPPIVDIGAYELQNMLYLYLPLVVR